MSDSTSDPLSGLGLTGILVAGARAAESARRDRLIDDPLAGAFVEAARAASPRIARVLEESSGDETINQVRRDAIAVRTRYFDEYLLSATRSGSRQVVLLAAGLDARAYRLRWREGVRLWELDMPEVFAFKERVLSARGATPGCERRVVPVDLREAWPAALVQAGFEPSTSTAWLIEGLLMYLDEGERDLLLDRVSLLSSAGSRLALDHRGGFISTPTLTSADDVKGDRAAARFAALAAAAGSDLSLTEPAEWLRRHGWRGQLDDPAEALVRYGRSVPMALRTAASSPRGWIARAERA
jgi:methyltransferase (TIGR00027 family)